MDAEFSRRKLLERDQLRALYERSDLRGLVQAGSHVGAVLLTGFILWQTWGSWWAVPAFIAHGILLNFLYAGQHELSHGTVFKSKWLNEWLGRAIGFTMMYPRDFDKIQHFAHHQYTQNWEKDGELVREPYTLGSYLLWFFGPTYWYSRIRRIIRFAFGTVTEPYIFKAQHELVIKEARWHLLGYALIAALSVYFQSWAAVLLWLAPMMTLKFVHQLQNTIEHLGLSHEDNTLVNTRSTDTNALMRWMCWQMQYHTAHHTFPSVPFWKLRELNDQIEGKLGHEVNRMGYIEFQLELIRKLSGGKSEADYPMNEVWITRQPNGALDRVAYD
jgi:fatty acid desaturase